MLILRRWFCNNYVKKQIYLYYLCFKLVQKRIWTLKIIILNKLYYTTLRHAQLTRKSLVALVSLVESNVNGLTESEWRNDEVFMKLWNAMLESYHNYLKTLSNPRSNSETQKIAYAQLVVERSYKALKRAVAVFEVSENVSEQEACKILKELFRSVEKEVQKSSETKSSNKNLLVSRLKSTEYASMVSLIRVGDYVDRLDVANADFSNLSKVKMGKRIKVKGAGVVITRADLMDAYQLVLNYALTLAQADKYPFMKVFDAIEVARKVYATDLQARTTRAETIKAQAESKKQEDGNNSAA